MSCRYRLLVLRAAAVAFFALALTLPGCCLWRYVGVVFVGRAVATVPSAQALSGDYRVRQYGGCSARATWPRDLVLRVHSDGTLTCDGDCSLFAKDFGVSEAAIDPKHLGNWSFAAGNKDFPVTVSLVVGGVTIPSHLLRSGDQFGLGISEAWGGDPDDRNTLEFLQDGSHPTK